MDARAVVVIALAFASCALRPSVRSPLRIGAEGAISQQAVDDAAGWWNERLGCRVFMGPSNGSDVAVLEGGSSPALVGMWTPYPASIHVYNVADDVAMHFVLVHELGHVLGVKHSDNRRSVMYWKPLASVDLMGNEDAFGAFPWVESATVDRLRAEACR